MDIVKPAEVGLCAERLARIDSFLERDFLEPGKLAGTQTLVARHGRVAHFSTLGSMALGGTEPMHEDADRVVGRAAIHLNTSRGRHAGELRRHLDQALFFRRRRDPKYSAGSDTRDD